MEPPSPRVPRAAVLGERNANAGTASASRTGALSKALGTARNTLVGPFQRTLSRHRERSRNRTAGHSDATRTKCVFSSAPGAAVASRHSTSRFQTQSPYQ